MFTTNIATRNTAAVTVISKNSVISIVNEVRIAYRYLFVFITFLNMLYDSAEFSILVVG